MTEESKDQGKTFDVSKYQITPETVVQTVTIPETGDEIDLTVKQLLGQDETNWFPNVLRGARMAKVPLMAIYILESV